MNRNPLLRVLHHLHLQQVPTYKMVTEIMVSSHFATLAVLTKELLLQILSKSDNLLIARLAWLELWVLQKWAPLSIMAIPVDLPVLERTAVRHHGTHCTVLERTCSLTFTKRTVALLRAHSKLKAAQALTLEATS